MLLNGARCVHAIGTARVTQTYAMVLDIEKLGLTQKVAFACGSIVRFFLYISFFARLGEKRYAEDLRSAACVSP